MKPPRPLAQRLAAVGALLACFARASLIDEYERCERVEPTLRSTGGERLTVAAAAASVSSRLPAALTLSIAAFNRTFELELAVSARLFADGFAAATTVAAPAANVASTTTTPPPPAARLRTDCYYSGRASGCSSCVAAFTLCDGLCVGFFTHDGETYVVGLDDGGGGGGGAAHCIARESDSKRRPSSRFRRRRRQARRGPVQPARSSAEAVAAVRPAGSDAATRFIELYVVMDRSLYRKHGARTAARGVEIVNFASALLRPLNIYIVLVGLEVWSSSDRITISRDPGATLANFLYHRQYYINPSVRNDNAQLLIGSGMEFDEGVLGKAEIAGMCTRSRSGGVAMDSRESSLAAAATMAHELGHNLGLLHDESYYSTSDDAPFADLYGPASAVQVRSGQRCSCGDPSGKCIMSGLLDSGSLPVTWSDCSKSHLAELFGEGGADACLRNMPTLLPGDLKRCGNYIVEPGEDCDCGPWGTCDNPCCDASTCRLKSGAVCGSGECCDLSTCTYAAAGRTCRPPASDDDGGSCDLAEYCSGTSAQCPEDLHLRDGAPCSSPGGGGPSHCYRGRCRTRGSQCRKLWGSTGREASRACYSTLNRLGSAQGHCGYDPLYNIYTSCEPQHVECGLLQCEERAEKLAFWQAASLGDSVRTVPDGGTAGHSGDVAYCRSVALDATPGIANPAMVPDGAPCGDGGMCVASRCVPLAGVAEYGQCTAACNARGRCNNLGHCHCDVPYAPQTNCSQPGAGGSVDSGPASSATDDGQAASVPLIAGLVCGLPLAVIVVGFAYYYRDRIRRTCRDRRRSGLLPGGPSAAATAAVACCRCLTARYGNVRGCARSSTASTKAGKKLNRPAEGSAMARARQSLEISMPMLESTTNGLLDWDKEQMQPVAPAGLSAAAAAAAASTAATGATPPAKLTTPTSVRCGKLQSTAAAAASAADNIDKESMAKRPLLREQRLVSGNLADKSSRAVGSQQQQQQQLAQPTRSPLLPPAMIAARSQAAAVAAASCKQPAALSIDGEPGAKVKPARPPSLFGSEPGASAVAVAPAVSAAVPTQQPQPTVPAAANDPGNGVAAATVVGTSAALCAAPPARLGSPAVAIRPSAVPTQPQQQQLLQHCESAPTIARDSASQNASDKAARGVAVKLGCSPLLSGRAAFLQPPASNVIAASATTAIKSPTPLVTKKPLAAASSVPVPAAAPPSASVKRAPSLSSSKPTSAVGSAGTATAVAAVTAAVAACNAPASSASPRAGHKTAAVVCKNTSPAASGDSGRTDGSPRFAIKGAAPSSNGGSPSGRRPKPSSPGPARAAAALPIAGAVECARPEVVGTATAASPKQQKQQKPQYENVRTVAAARAALATDNGLYDDVVLMPPGERQQSSRVT